MLKWNSIVCIITFNRTFIVNKEDLQFIEKEIPINRPLTQEMFNFVSKYWTCYYTPTKKSINIKDLDQDKINEVKSIFERLLKLNKSDNVESLLYDPKRKIVLSEASNSNEVNPISHSIMKLIENFANSTVKSINNLNFETYNKIEEKSKELGKEQIEIEIKLEDKELYFKVKEKEKDIHNYNLYEVDNNQNTIKDKDKDQSQISNVLLGEKRESCFQSYFTNFNYEEQYFCKDLYIFTIKEPCIMCAMALGIYFCL